MEATQIVILMEGGLIESVMASKEADIYLIDFDTAGADQAAVADIPQGDGSTVKAYVCRPSIKVNEERTAELITTIAAKIASDSITTVREIGIPGSGGTREEIEEGRGLKPSDD
jgi:hypothetical protein